MCDAAPLSSPSSLLSRPLRCHNCLIPQIDGDDGDEKEEEEEEEEVLTPLLAVVALATL